ncbi:cysteine hydrolase family protein [Pseudomonas japonica]|uniref:Nicotinamidase-related amidase n=1 Tax=Pseudomonas japonica TaxID=256466 RepID=A0A239FYI6_9PSED|nr:cysteine hydrolase family protein [Pseudomonas japonica]SNS61332.1 Nicotinamidase-related amidase [Pseudomonas japonica]
MLEDNAALLIVDMQKGIANPAGVRRNNPDAEQQVEALLRAWRTSRRPVVHVRHISRSADSVFRPGQVGCEFQEALAPLGNEQVFEKNVPDAFVASGLERWLHVRGIRQLVVCGVATNNSVEATARTGGNLGFDVVVVADACYTFDLLGRDGRCWAAAEVHALSLDNLAMDYARVLDTRDVLNAAF